MATSEISPRRTAVELARPESLDRQLAAERSMLHAIIRGTLVALPFALAIFFTMMAIAISNKEPWYVWIGLSAVIGVYAAGFFGAVGGVMLSAHTFDELDEEAMHTDADDGS